MCYTVNQWSPAARRCLFRMGPLYSHWACSVNRLGWLRMACVDMWALWRPGVSATVLEDGLHWAYGCLRRICKSFDGVVLGGCPQRGWFQVVPISCRRCFNYKIVVRGALKRLAPSAVLKLVCRIPMSFLCWRCWGHSKSFFFGMKCFGNTQVTRDCRRSNAWFD